jgi:hypothetical protein
MHFPSDMTDPPTRTSHPHTDRQIYLAPVVGGAATALSAERDEWTSTLDPALAPFAQPITWYEGRELRRLPLPVTEQYIPVVEQRLERNRELLDAYPKQLEDNEHLLEADQAAVDQAYAAIERVVRNDYAQTGVMNSPGLIINHTVTIDPNLYVTTRRCWLRETAEWNNHEFTRMRLGPAMTARKQERSRLQRALDQEHINTTLLQSRLHHLRENVDWWRRRFGPLP